jgi:hypothetical protein
MRILYFALMSGALLAQSSFDLDRAQRELARLKELAAAGAVAPVRVAEAERNLQDAQDGQVLDRTLYGKLTLQDLSEQQAAEMVKAAARRLERQTARIEQTRKLVDAGVRPRNEMEPLAAEHEARAQVLKFAESRAKLLHELIAMAQAEQTAEQHRSFAAPFASGPLMEAFGGAGVFTDQMFDALAKAFQVQFQAALPVSARGETAVHRALGFDHRGRVDLGLSPDSPEGLWVRRYLTQHQIPYIAFRAAVAGSATAPHIHLGLPSPRLAVAD